MGSRIREGVKRFFECFCEVAKPQKDVEPWIVQKFPESYKDEEVLKSVPKFAFPCDFERGSVQHFNFVLTDIDSKWTFGYVRHGTRSETALVVLSSLPWHESFHKFLNALSDVIESPNSSHVWQMLQTVYDMPPPDPGGTLTVSYNDGQDKTYICKCPDQFQLPSIPENRNLTEYYSAVDAQNMMIVFASMLYERRIIFTSKRLSRLSACVQAANAVIYPMNWQHIFIPVLPLSLVDYLLAPMPFLIGVPTPVLQRVSKADLGEVVILNADNNTVETPFDDIDTLPVDVVSSLKRKLRNRATLLGDGVSRAFLQALVQLIGGYRDALRFYQGEKITFNSDAFVESRPPSIQPFLRKMLELQIFQQFIEERLQMLNAGRGFSDEFELETCNYSAKSSSRMKQHYKEWASTMKKEGSAFFKTVKSKANPAVKSAVKTVKERGKEVKERSRTAYKGIRSRFGEGQTSNHHLEHSASASDVISFTGKPRSAPASPTAARRRPKTLADSNGAGIKSYYKDPGNHLKPATDNRGRSLSAALASLDTSPESPERPLQFSPIDMDLLGDMQDVIFRDCYQLGEQARRDLEEDDTKLFVDRSLKPASSLDDSQRVQALRPPPPLSQQRSAPLPQVPSTSFAKPPFPEPDDDDDLPVFTTASGHPPPIIVPPPRSRKQHNLPPKPNAQPSGDLIRLDSTPSEDFDPLKPSGRSSGAGNTSFSAELLGAHPVFEPVPPIKAGPSTSRSQLNATDRDLLKEYGLEFESSSDGWLPGASNPFTKFTAAAPNPKGRWATFD